MFTQQHYEALAHVLRETREKLTADSGSSPTEITLLKVQQDAIGQFQLKLQALLKQDNPKFKELLFIGAASEHAP